MKAGESATDLTAPKQRVHQVDATERLQQRHGEPRSASRSRGRMRGSSISGLRDKQMSLTGMAIGVRLR